MLSGGNKKKGLCRICNNPVTIVTVKVTGTHHYGCHPCDFCNKSITRRRTIRIAILPDKVSKAPWDCTCLDRLGSVKLGQLYTEEILYKIEHHEARDIELPDMIRHSLSLIDVPLILDRMEHHRILTSVYSPRDAAVMADLKLILLNGAPEPKPNLPPGGWSGYPNKIKK